MPTTEIEIRNFIFHFRKIPDWLRQSPIAFHCLAEFGRRASYEERDVAINGELVHLMPREFITGRLEVCEKLNISEGRFRGAYKKLVKYGCIRTIRITQRYTISLYCDTNAFYVYTEQNLPSEKPTDGPTANQQLTTNNTVDTGDTGSDIESRIDKSEVAEKQESPGYLACKETAKGLGWKEK